MPPVSRSSARGSAFGRHAVSFAGVVQNRHSAHSGKMYKVHICSRIAVR